MSAADRMEVVGRASPIGLGSCDTQLISGSTLVREDGPLDESTSVAL
jgi:hypothetical protein